MKRLIGFFLLAGGLLFTLVGFFGILAGPDEFQDLAITDILEGTVPEDAKFVTISDGQIFAPAMIEHYETRDNSSVDKPLRYIFPYGDEQHMREWATTFFSQDKGRPELRGDAGKFVFVLFKPDEFRMKYPQSAPGKSSYDDKDMILSHTVSGKILDNFTLPSGLADFVKTELGLTPDQYLYIKLGEEPAEHGDLISGTIVFAAITVVGWFMFRKKKPKNPGMVDAGFTFAGDLENENTPS